MDTTYKAQSRAGRPLWLVEDAFLHPHKIFLTGDQNLSLDFLDC